MIRIATVLLAASVTTSLAQMPGTAKSPTLATAEAVVQQPRPYGYFVGDIVTQRISLQGARRSFTPVALPPTQRVSVWFERRRATIETDSALRRWLVVDYQVLNAPQKLTAVRLPAWQLAVGAKQLSSGGSGVAADGAAASAGPVSAAAGPRAAASAATANITLRIPATLINIAPLSPPGSPAQVGAQDLRPDRWPPIVATEPLWRGIALACGALALTLVAWLAWVIWRNRRAVATRPFASALREMRRLDAREPRAWQALHRAFDRTAGTVVQGTTLPVLFERAPQLNALREPIERFFQQSGSLFFGGDTAAEPLSPRELCAELRRIERRHER